MVLMSSYLLLVMSVHSPSRNIENNDIVMKGIGKSWKKSFSTLVMVLMSSYLLLVMSVHSPSRNIENNNIVMKGIG